MNCVNCSRRSPKRSAQCVYHTGTMVYSTARAGISCIKKEGRIINSSIIRWTFFQFRRRPHGHRYGKKPGDKEYYTANQLKKRCKKKYFQGIHDRFIRDPEFRIRMIENHGDEELCRRWDALADEDHTHHLTTQEYSLYKSKWWLHSNKQGSNTMPLTQRPDFKQALSTLHRLQREAEEDPQVPTYSNKSQQWAQSSSSTWWNLARFMVDPLSFRKSRRRCTKY